MSEIKYVNTLGFKVFSDNLDLISIENSSAKVINCISPNSYGLTTKNPLYREYLKKTDYLILDGVYFALSSILLQRKNIKRNQGPDVFDHFIARLSKYNSKAFFLGSTPEVLGKIQARMVKEYPGIETGYYSPPFKQEFDEIDNSRMVDAVNQFEPNILFVGMTTPKQEIWAIKNRELLKCGLVIGVGNVFDWFSGTQKSIHPIWFKLRVGWLVRIFLRPEIFKRNIGNQLKFFSDVILIFLRLKKDNNA